MPGNDSVGKIELDLEADVGSLEQEIEQAGAKLSATIQEAFQSVLDRSLSKLNAIEKETHKTADDISSKVKAESAKIKQVTTEVASEASRKSKKHLLGAFDGLQKKARSESTAAGNVISQRMIRSAVDIKAAFDMAIGTIRMLVSESKEFMSAYQTQIEAEARLAATMRNSTGATNKQIQSVKDLASEIQRLGIVGDEVQLAGAQELATYVSSTESIKKMLPVLDDMIAQQYGYNATAESSVTIATMLGKVLQGQTSALSRYGYNFDKSQEKLLKYGTEEQRVATLASVVSESVGGVNKTLAGTSTGKIKQLSNDFGDLKEHLGNLITNTLAPAARWLDVIVVKANTLLEKANLFVKKLFDIKDMVGGAGFGAIADTSAESTENIEATTKAAEKLKKTVAGFDQLNILSSDSGSTGGEEGGSPEEGAALSMPEPDVSGTEKAVDGIGKKLDKLKAKLKGLYKTGGLQKAVRNFQKQVDKINIDKIKSNFQSIFTSLEPIAKAGFDGVAKIAKSKLAFIGTLYGGLTRTAANALQTASGGIAKWLDEDKEKIAGYISSISDHISSGIDNCSEFASTMLDTFNESVERMRPETEKAIAEMLSGFTTFGGSVGEAVSEGFEIATEVAAQWAEDNKELIGTAFDNAQKIVNDCMSGIGKVFKDVGNDIASWWRSGGASVWKGFCKIVGDLGTIALRTFNEKIMPAWKSLTSTLKKGWDGCIRPILKRASSSLTKLWKQIIQPLWDNVLKPIISQIVDKEGKRLLRFVNQAGKTCSTVFDNIKNYVTKIFDALDHLIDFVTDVFKGDWESAWKDIKAFGKDAFEALVTSAKGQFNLLIDAVNSVWSGIYSFFSDFVNSMSGTVKEIGKAVGQDWDISVPAEPAYIPHLAKGGLVKAPTLAMVGDNKGASHDPEVVSPLSKLESMIKNRDPEIVRLLAKIAGLLERDESVYQNNIYLDGEVIERRLVKVRRRKQRRYGGATV